MDKERTGELLVLSAGLLWSLFPIITKLAYNSLSPLHTAGWSALFAAVFFIVVSGARKTFLELKNKTAYKPMILTTILNGILFYGLLFTGLKYTTAGNAAILSLMEILFTMAILRLWKKEELEKKQILGSLLMIVGAVLVLVNKQFLFNSGDWIIIAAVAIPPFGNYYAKQAREHVSSSTILLVRNLVSGIALMLIGSFFFTTPAIAELKPSLIFLAINGLILFGLTKLLWLEAIHRLLIGKAIALSSISPLFTVIFAFFILNEVPTVGQIAGLVSVITGIYLLTKKDHQKNRLRWLFDSVKSKAKRQ